MSKILEKLSSLKPRGNFASAPRSSFLSKGMSSGPIRRKSLAPLLALMIFAAAGFWYRGKFLVMQNENRNLASSQTPVSADNGPTLSDLFVRNRSAINSYYMGEYSLSEQNLRSVIDVRPEDATPKANLAAVLYRQEKVKEAKDLYAEALKIDSENAAALVGMGKIALDEGEPEEAEEFFGRSLASAPAHAEILLNLGQAAEEQDKWATASAYYAKFLETAQANDRMRSVIAARIEKLRGRPDAQKTEQL